MAGLYGTAPPRPRGGSSFKAWKPWAPPKMSQFGMGGTPQAMSAGQAPNTGDSNPWDLGGPDTGVPGGAGGTLQDEINAGNVPWIPSLGDIGYTAPQIGDTSGGTDWGALIGGDYEVQAAEAAMGAGMARRRGDFQAQLRQAMIDLGLTDMTKLGSFGKYIDKDTIQKAIDNKYSATAQSAQSAQRATAQSRAALAARGMLSSGQTAKTDEDIIANKEQQNYTFLRDFLSGGQAGLTGLADAEEGYAMAIAQARSAAASRAAEWAWRKKQADAEDAKDRAAAGAGAGRGAGAEYTGGPGVRTAFNRAANQHSAYGYGNVTGMHPVSWYRKHPGR